MRVEHLVKAYAGRRVVDDVTFTVPAASVCALLGRNGAGKTTTAECIGGFRAPDGGDVCVLGAKPSARRAELGFMLQEGGAWPAATPAEMLGLYARLYSDPLDPGELLTRLDIADAAGTRYRSLSGGQKQRLNLALALIGRPKVVILDEPTAGMDPGARHRTWDLIRELRADAVAVLLATHDMEEAERLADTVAVIDAGKLVALDSPAALVAHAASDRVLLMTPAALDTAALAGAVGAGVQPDGSGRFIVHAGSHIIPEVSAWFAARNLPLTGLSAAGGGLEDVFLRLTGNPPDD